MPVLNVANIIFPKAVAMYHCSIVLIIFGIDHRGQCPAHRFCSARSVCFRFTGNPDWDDSDDSTAGSPGGACSPIICGNVKMDSDDYQMSYLPG